MWRSIYIQLWYFELISVHLNLNWMITYSSFLDQVKLYRQIIPRITYETVTANIWLWVQAYLGRWLLWPTITIFWLIRSIYVLSKRTEPSHTLELTFIDFDLETTTNCNDDFVQVYDGHEKRADRLLLDRTCGTDMLNNTLRSDCNELMVIFQSGSHLGAKGFAAEFKTACGAKINASGSGILEIGHNLRSLVVDCRWTIRANNPSSVMKE